MTSKLLIAMVFILTFMLGFCIGKCKKQKEGKKQMTFEEYQQTEEYIQGEYP